MIKKYFSKPKPTKLILNLLILLLVLHGIRDLMQALGINFFYTQIGHDQGIKWSNAFWGVWGIKYERWSEWLMVVVETLLIYKLLKIRKDA